VFLVVLFYIKNRSGAENQAGLQPTLAYNDTDTLADLVNRDTDQDGVLDWEENLWGTNPKLKETTPGTPDVTAIEELKTKDGKTGSPISGNLTETDKFTQELFSTVSVLSQSGTLDQVTVDKLSETLANQIKNSPVEKIYGISDLKVKKDAGVAAITKYNDEMYAKLKKYPLRESPIDILDEATTEDGNIDGQVLEKLDPIAEQIKKIVGEMLQIDVPETFTTYHLALINSLEKLSENLTDVQSIDTDVIVALGAMSQMEQNIDSLESSTANLQAALEKKLNS